MQLNRREFLRIGRALVPGVVLGPGLGALTGCDLHVPSGPYGPLGTPDENGFQLPAGFSSRILATAGETVSGTEHVWHVLPDGGATFATNDGGWIYVSNSESPLGFGGVGALRFDSAANVVDAYRICTNTTLNCAGGATPWDTWLTCEEIPDGFVWECDPEVPDSQVKHRALGKFRHEAVAVDPNDGRLYLTEDESDGCFYRYTPNSFGDLDNGVLEVADLGPHKVRWHEVPNPTPRNTANKPTRRQVPESAAFDGGEGIVYSGGFIFFSTKGDNRIWRYDPTMREICVVYEAGLDPGRQLTGVDNVNTSSGGDLFVAEDGGNMELVVLTPEGEAAPILRVLGQDSSELAGPAFNPAGDRLYVSSQRGNTLGITYEISGPFRSNTLF